MSELHAWAGGSAQRFEDGLDDAFGVRWATEDAETADLPLDVVPVFSASDEGPTYGFVDLVPESGQVAQPMVRCADGRTRWFAVDVRTGLARLHAMRLEWDDDVEPQLRRWVAQSLGVVDAGAANVPWPPPRPLGYHYVGTRDGLGVMAPSRAFDLEVLRGDPSLSIAEHQAWVTRLLHHGRPGSALVVVKDALFEGARQPAVWSTLGRLAAEVLLTLGRPTAAQRARRRAARFG
jgi:hypothetical protein